MAVRFLKLTIIRTLYGACRLIDEVAYRPAVVKLTRCLPWFWCCQLAHLSIKLDERWQMGYWDASDAPPKPDRLCDACQRRAAWLEAGGHYDGIDGDGDDSKRDYMKSHPVNLCGWCHLDVDFDAPPQNAEELKLLLEDAASRSIEWRWRWHPG
jgi:hypothetical protein